MENANPDSISGNKVGKRTANRSQRLLLGSKVISIFLGFFITIILGRFLSPADFGFLAMVTLIFALSRDLLGLGTSNIATREIVRSPASEGALLGRLLGWRRIQAGFLGLLCLGFSFAQYEDYQKWVLVLAAGVIFLYYLGALLPVFQVRQQYGWPVILNVTGQIGLFLGCILFIQIEGPAIVFPLMVLAREAFVIIGTKVKAEQLLGFKPAPTVRGGGYEKFFGQAVLFGLAALFYIMYFFSGTFLVWLFLGGDALGGYSAAFRPIQPLFSFPWLYALPLIPVFSWLAKEDKEKFKKLFTGNLDLAIGVGAIGVVTGICLGPSWLDIFYSGKYSAGPLSANATLQVICLAFGFSCANPLLVSGLLAVGEEKKLFKLVALGFVVNVVCNSILLPKMGFTAAGVCLAISESITFFGGIAILSYKLKGMNWNLNIFLYVAPAVVLFVLFNVVPASTTLVLSILTLISFGAIIILWRIPVARNCRRELAMVVPENYSQPGNA